MCAVETLFRKKPMTLRERRGAFNIKVLSMKRVMILNEERVATRYAVRESTVTRVKLYSQLLISL